MILVIVLEIGWTYTSPVTINRQEPCQTANPAQSRAFPRRHPAARATVPRFRAKTAHPPTAGSPCRAVASRRRKPPLYSPLQYSRRYKPAAPTERPFPPLLAQQVHSACCTFQRVHSPRCTPPQYSRRYAPAALHPPQSAPRLTSQPQSGKDSTRHGFGQLPPQKCSHYQRL